MSSDARRVRDRGHGHTARSGFEDSARPGNTRRRLWPGNACHRRHTQQLFASKNVGKYWSND